jgi:hypothetical protein
VGEQLGDYSSVCVAQFSQGVGHLATRAISAMIAVLPGLRPGATFNQGERVTSVTLAGNQMAIKWKTQSAAA